MLRDGCRVGLCWLALICFAGGASTQAEEFPLDRGWRLAFGDDPAWSAPEFNDSNWRAVSVGETWESALGIERDGYAWYRLHFILPQASADRQANSKRLWLLNLGYIDDADQTWLNGQPVGETGSFPPEYEPAYREERRYLIPSDTLRWGKENVLAVRVYDGSRGGGLYSGSPKLVTATWKDCVGLELEMAPEDGLFAGGQRIGITAVLQNQVDRRWNGRVEWQLEDDEWNILTTDQTKVAFDRAGGQRLTKRFDVATAGFYRIRCRLISEGDGEGIKQSMVVGLGAETVSAPLTAMPDFDAFWRRTLTELALVPPEFRLIRHAQFDSATHDVFEVAMKSHGGVEVRGWYERPRGHDPVPALIRVPGYTQNMRPTGWSDPLAIFSFNIRGHGNSQKDVPGQPENYWIRGLDSPDGYFYQGAYADCVRAVDFLVSRSEVDPGRIAITGGSQGGGLSLAAAALDQRIRACAPDIPFLCDWEKYFRTSHWPEMDGWIAAQPERTWATTLRTLSYFDTLNLAERIRCPVFCGLGVQDDVCPPATVFAVFNRLPGEKQYRAYARAKHSVGYGHSVARKEWLLQRLGVAAVSGD